MRVRRVKAAQSIGPIRKDGLYELVGMTELSYKINVGGVIMTYAKELFFYKG
jgi:hypothetical protein